MTTLNRGVGKFTTQSLAAFRAMPETNGAYADVAEDHDGGVHPHSIAGWTQNGNADIRGNKDATAGHSLTTKSRSRDLCASSLAISA